MYVFLMISVLNVNCSKKGIIYFSFVNKWVTLVDVLLNFNKEFILYLI
jgi:hypothetical protein